MSGERLCRHVVAAAAAALAACVACVACGRSYGAGEATPGGTESDAAVDATSNDASSPPDADVDAGRDDASTSADGAPDPSLDIPRIFITSAKYDGFFGGLGGGDAKCAGLAASQGLHGVYKAWLSSLSQDAYARIKGNGPWYRIDGTSLVFGSKGAILLGPARPVLATELGSSVPGEPVWTGTNASGVATNTTCADWTNQFGTGTIGESDKVGPSWTEAPSLTLACNTQAHLICMRAD